MPSNTSGGGNKPGGAASIRVVPAAQHDAQVNKLLRAISLPADTRLRVVVEYEDGAVRVVVRALGLDVIGDHEVPLNADLVAEARALGKAILAEYGDAATGALRRGVAETLAAAMSGREG